MLGLQLTDKVPFETVYLHGLVRLVYTIIMIYIIVMYMCVSFICVYYYLFICVCIVCTTIHLCTFIIYNSNFIT